MVNPAPSPSTLDERQELARRARRRLLDALDAALGDQLVLEEGERHHRRDDLVRVDGFATSFRCPRRLARPADDYQDTVATVRRRIGLLALRHADEHHVSPSAPRAPLDLRASVGAVLDDRADWYPSLREWVGGLDRAGRAAVEAAAFTWASDAARLLGAVERVGWTDPLRPLLWNVPGRAVQIRSSVDAVRGSLRAGQRLLLVGDAVPGPGGRIRAGHLAVVQSVLSGAAPLRVSLGSPASGAIEPVVVDDALVELAIDRIVEAVRILVRPEEAPPQPGRWCGHCHLRAVCDEGAAHLRSIDAADR